MNPNRIAGKYGLIAGIVLFLAWGCSKEATHRQDGDVYLYLSVIAASSINEDDESWEDRVDELRMLAFDSSDGGVIYNEKLYFPDGFDLQSRFVRMRPGTYDFYFIANETVYEGDFVDALLDIANVSEFTTDSRFLQLPFRVGFTPDRTSREGRFLMSAVYKDVTLVSGGTETNPLPIPLPTSRVELIRAMAKIEVIFRKNVSGSTVPEGTVTSVELDDIATTLSVPPFDGFYTGRTDYTPSADLSGFDYGQDSIGRVVFYVPEFLVSAAGTEYTTLHINNQIYPVQSDDEMAGLTAQRRSIPGLSNYSVIRNYHYIVNVYLNGEGGVRLEVHVEPWHIDSYVYIFQGDQQITLPPIDTTDSSIIFPTDCGTIEMISTNEYLSQGLQGAYHDQVVYYDPATQGPIIIPGDPPYYCEQKYGPGWRLINSCELMSFLALTDEAYNIWTSNTWEAQAYDMPFYSLRFRRQAQELLIKLTGANLEGSVLFAQNNYADEMTDLKVNLIDLYLTPGDIKIREEDFPDGWPYSSPPGTDLAWFYNQASIQVKAYWYGSEYLSPSDRSNWNTILYNEFERYDYSSTVSRCVRPVE